VAGQLGNEAAEMEPLNLDEEAAKPEPEAKGNLPEMCEVRFPHTRV
jgi:hypothetical protein